MSETQEIKRYFLINHNIEEEKLTEIIESIHATNEFDDDYEHQIVDYQRIPIKVVVESFGGDCYSGMSLVNTILTSRTPIHTYSYGKTMSMGVPIFAAGHIRFAHENTTFMYHQMSGRMHGSTEAIKDNVEEWERLEEVIDGILFEHTDIPMDAIETHKLLKKDWFFSGKEAYRYGLVDVLLDSIKRERVSDDETENEDSDDADSTEEVKDVVNNSGTEGEDEK